MIRTAIVGCGKVADRHVLQIRRIPHAEIVAVCDAEPLMARQLADRFNIARQFVHVKQMLDESRPDVVHITAPPQSHFSLAKLCLQAGCNVYVEKPFTLYASE